MKVEIGINQRIPISILEMALVATLNEESSPEYFTELAQTEYDGENRIKKAVSVMNRLTVRNAILPYLKEHKDDILLALRDKNDKALILSAVINSAYSFGYDTASTLGKYFHVQDQVTRDFIVSKMATKYGSNRSLENALSCVLPMFIEAGILMRPKVGFYEIRKIEHCNEIAINTYRKSFYINNPALFESDGCDTNPYFEFVNLL